MVMIDDERVVRDVLHMWGEGIEQTKESWRRNCHDDMEWFNCARGSIVGLPNCLHAIDDMFAALGVDYVKTPIRRLHAAPGIVFVERSDDLYRADDSLIAAVPVVAVVELEDGKIRTWRDYCDDWVSDLQAAHLAPAHLNVRGEPSSTPT